MSYILDALRKSDQQRQRGATPTLLTAQIAAEEPRQSDNWIYGLIAAVLIGAGIAIGWLHPWQSEPPAPAEQPIAGVRAAREIVAAKRPESGPGLGQPTPAPVASVPGPALPDVNRTPAQEAPVQKPAAQPATASPAAAMTPVRPAPSSSSVDTAGAAAVDPAQDARVMTMGELPPSILQELPAMQISLHLHSTRPANRFVSINNQMLQEGAYAAPGLKLEQITPDGMVFSYKGYRFRRGVQ